MKLKCLLTLAALATISAQLSTLRAQGALTPPGAPAPTMKSLAQVEPRTPISAVPFTINTPGSYYLTTNVTTSVSNAIVIAVSGVTLDLSGFTIASTVANAANGGTAILIGGGLKNLTIINGFIQSGVTNNGSGVYSGSGFNSGINYSPITSPINVLVARLSISGCLNNGIFLNTSDSTVVEACTVRTVGNYGINAANVKSCAAVDCGGFGIVCDLVSDSRGEASTSGYGISANLTAQNCYGESNSGFGLYSFGTATGCYGYSVSGTGLTALIGNSCRGRTISGTGLSVTHNLNCF